jgi:hypothetical protein
VRDGLQAKAGRRRLVKVESLTKKGKLVACEAQVVTAGKREPSSSERPLYRDFRQWCAVERASHEQARNHWPSAPNCDAHAPVGANRQVRVRLPRTGPQREHLQHAVPQLQTDRQRIRRREKSGLYARYRCCRYRSQSGVCKGSSILDEDRNAGEQVD